MSSALAVWILLFCTQAFSHPHGTVNEVAFEIALNIPFTIYRKTKAPHKTIGVWLMNSYNPTPILFFGPRTLAFLQPFAWALFEWIHDSVSVPWGSRGSMHRPLQASLHKCGLQIQCCPGFLHSPCWWHKCPWCTFACLAQCHFLHCLAYFSKLEKRENMSAFP